MDYHFDKNDTLIDILQARSLQTPHEEVYGFLNDDGSDGQILTYRQLDNRARAIAAHFQSQGLQNEIALLAYPTSAGYIEAFFGCLYAGVIPVPAYPPKKNRSVERILSILKDTKAKILLTTTEVRSDISWMLGENEDLNNIQLIYSDQVSNDNIALWERPVIGDQSLAFLQYTSGSTGIPKGVMVTHRNIIHNLEIVKRAFGHDRTTIGVGWLPLFHDMGLIGNVFQPLYAGFPMKLMTPVSFLQKPVRWLNAVSRYKATTSGAPNFAYDLCVNKVTAEQMSGLDLGSWQVAFNGAEPVKAETIRQFAKKFGPVHFREEAFYPCYGMAEATLFISGGPKLRKHVIKAVDTQALEKGRVVFRDNPDRSTKEFVSCGHCWLGHECLIVDPVKLSPVSENEVGEIYISGECVASGYWRREDLTNESFGAMIGPTGSKTFLRSGDLGFMKEGELFVSGRIKDMIIIRGRNHYPQDIESIAEKSHASLAPGAGAAFSITADSEELLVVVNEVKRDYIQGLNVQEVFDAIRESIIEHHGIQAHAIVLLKPGSISRTSSGKIQRRIIRGKFLDDTLNIVAIDTQGLPEEEKISPAGIVFGNNLLTYEIINKKAESIADGLRNIGIVPGTKTGIYITNCPEAVIGLIGIIKAGGIFVRLSIADSGELSSGWRQDNLIKLIPARVPNLKMPGEIKKLVYLDELQPQFSGNQSDNGLDRGSPDDTVFIDYPDDETASRIAFTKTDIIRYFGVLDTNIGKPDVSRFFIEEELSSISSILEMLWAISRGYTISFHAIFGTGGQQDTQSNDAIDFSLFYFSSNHNDFTNDKYKLVIEGAKYADKNNFRAVWIPERHFHQFGGLYPNPSVLCAALAMITERIRLRAGSVVIPLHHPARVAEEWSVVDNLSNGRVDLAFARGWNPNDFILFPEAFANNKEVLFSRISDVKKLWKGVPLSGINGEGKETKVEIYPRPIQKDLQIWLTCSGGEERFIEAGASGANILTALLFQPVEQLTEKIKKYRAARERNGFNPDSGKVTLMLHTYVGNDLATVKQEVKGPFIEYLKSSIDLWKTESTDLKNLNETDKENLLLYAFERYFQTSALFGTPETCLETIKKFKAIGVDEIACLIDFGVSTELVLSSLNSLNQLRKLALTEAMIKHPFFGEKKDELFGIEETLIVQCSSDRAGKLADMIFAGKAKLKLLVADDRIDQLEVFSNISAFSKSDRMNFLTEEEVEEQETAEISMPAHIFLNTISKPQAQNPLPDYNLIRNGLLQTIRAQLSKATGLDVHAIPADKSFNSLGIDSLKAIEMMHELEAILEIPLSPVLLFEFPTLNKFIDHLAQNYHLIGRKASQVNNPDKISEAI